MEEGGVGGVRQRGFAELWRARRSRWRGRGATSCLLPFVLSLLVTLDEAHAEDTAVLDVRDRACLTLSPCAAYGSEMGCSEGKVCEELAFPSGEDRRVCAQEGRTRAAIFCCTSSADCPVQEGRTLSCSRDESWGLDSSFVGMRTGLCLDSSKDYCFEDSEYPPLVQAIRCHRYGDDTRPVFYEEGDCDADGLANEEDDEPCWADDEEDDELDASVIDPSLDRLDAATPALDASPGGEDVDAGAMVGMDAASGDEGSGVQGGGGLLCSLRRPVQNGAHPFGVILGCLCIGLFAGYRRAWPSRKAGR